MKRTAIALLSMSLLGGFAVGCGGAGAKENSEVTITVTSRGYPEEEVLREIYAQALERAGFDVRHRDEPGLLPSDELEEGLVSGYPEHLDAILVELMHAEVEAIPGPAKAAYLEVKRGLEEKGLVPFIPTSFGRGKVVGIPRKVSAERDITSLADLRDSSRAMSAAGGEHFCYCKGRDCLRGLEARYGIVFEGHAVSEPASRLYKSLKTGKTDAGVFFATDGRLARGRHWLVLLEDEENRLPASNALWLTSQEVIDEAGPDYEKAILRAQKSLTLEVMRELDAKVELDGEPPGTVAAEYLKSIGFKG